MRLEDKKYLFDIQTAVSRLEKFTLNKTFDDYNLDELLQAGVERQFEIIGEATNKLNKQSPNIANQLPNMREMISFRNILIHAYDNIDPMIVWGVVESSLSLLSQKVEELLNQI